MKGRRILLDIAPDGAEAAALIVDGRLEDLLLSEPETRLRPEAVLRGRVSRLVPAIDAAFLDLGDGQRGFLNLEGRSLTEGAALTVEIRGWPEPGKAWPLTARPTLRGRRLALTPGAPGLNLSRSLKGAAARTAARAAVLEGLGGDEAALQTEGLGCVIRTAAGLEPEGLREEAAWLLARWRAVAAGAALPPGPGAAALALRDWGAEATATPRGLEALAAALETGLAPSDPRRGGVAEGAADLFERLDVWSMAEAALAARRDLGRGAWMAVEPTAALVAVDVNSGAESGALTADLAAAAALPRSLRIGGLAGLIAVDFLSAGARDRARIEAALTQGLRDDPVQTEILGFTAGGVLEMRRKRTRRRVTAERLRRQQRG